MHVLRQILVRVRRPAVLAAIACTAVVGGGSYALAATLAVTASSTDTLVSSTSSVNLSTSGSVQTTILSLILPGSSSSSRHYVLSASGDLVNFGASDYTRCSISVNGTQIAGVSTIVGDPAAASSQGPAGFLSPFTLAGGVSIPAGTTSETAILQCWHDHANGATPYVDPSASLLSHKTTSLTVATE